MGDARIDGSSGVHYGFMDLQSRAGREVPPIHRDDNPALCLRVIEEVMAPLYPAQHKPLLLQNVDDFLGRECRKFRLGLRR